LPALRGRPAIGHFLAPHSDPDELADQARVRFGETDERIAGGDVAPEDVDAAARHLGLDEPAVGGPEHTGRKPRRPRIVAPGAHAVDDVAGIALQATEEFDRELRRLLQIGRHDREIRPLRFLEAGTDRGERAEVARHLEELGIEPRCAAAPRSARRATGRGCRRPTNTTSSASSSSRFMSTSASRRSGIISSLR
jgi:hypothetical protein